MSIAIAAACFTATAPAVAGGFRIIIGGDGHYEGGKKERLYDGCATKREIFKALRHADAQPKRIVGVKGEIVFVRAYSYEDEMLYDYGVIACTLMVDGRYPVEQKKLVERK